MLTSTYRVCLKLQSLVKTVILTLDVNGYMFLLCIVVCKSNRKAMNRSWSKQKPNPALQTKAGHK